jgi:PIN domain nuclease of toxin-antitoxin system
MIYLDTHVVLWLYLRTGEGLSERARHSIEYEPEILISPMVLLELDYLHEVGRTTHSLITKDKTIQDHYEHAVW